jgi:histidine triad (HIT) family protein
MASIFTRIIRGEIPCEKIAEDERFIAFLDIRPIAPGHTLVIPKEERDHLFDYDSNYLSQALPFAKPIAQAIQSVTGRSRVGLLVAGFEVPHAHIHLVPIDQEGDLSFAHAKPASKEDLVAMGKAIRAALATI